MRRLAVVIVFFAALAAHAEVREVKNLDEIRQAFRPDTRIRVVSVWATWCAPCVAEIGGINDVAKTFRKSAVEIVGVSLDDAVASNRQEGEEKLSRFLAEKKVTFPNLYYTGKPGDLADEMHFDGAIPVTIVFDRYGREIARGEGVLDMKWFRDTLKMLEEKTR
ncbi:MAG TPA: TlpA disulfide reductase family protein [Thermoanaerobaculia bacterium]|jgi:thiol-disulfide isomerase/thioredoxin|nr:TlpA disulfide reductase family protein [Thermoanaerobaculia bacterium]